MTPASGKTVYKAGGATVDRVVVDFSQADRNGKPHKYIMPHMHYVAFSRVKKLDDLYVLNMNEDTMAIEMEYIYM